MTRASRRTRSLLAAGACAADTPQDPQMRLSDSARCLDLPMAQPHKGPRRGYLLRWSEQERQIAESRATKAGMTMAEYLIALMHRDEVDPDGCPVWAPNAQQIDQLPIDLSA